MAKTKQIEQPAQEEPTPVQALNAGETLEDQFREFESTDSTFDPENGLPPEQVDEAPPIPGNPAQVEPQLTAEQKIKIKMFLGFVCFLLSAGNTFIFNLIFKSEVPLKEMLLDDEEKAQVEPYLNSPQILAFIDRLPGWIIGVAHIEYMMYEKFADVKDLYPKKPNMKIVKEKLEETENQNPE